jgi:hypothetical protein
MAWYASAGVAAAAAGAYARFVVPQWRHLAEVHARTSATTTALAHAECWAQNGTCSVTIGPHTYVSQRLVNAEGGTSCSVGCPAARDAACPAAAAPLARWMWDHSAAARANPHSAARAGYCMGAAPDAGAYAAQVAVDGAVLAGLLALAVVTLAIAVDRTFACRRRCRLMARRERGRDYAV